MCQLCAEIASFGQDRISITNRPAHRLAGLRWAGTVEQAADRALYPLLETVRRFSDARIAAWKSPIVGLSSDMRQDGFVGVAVEQDEAIPAAFESLDVPEMNFATSWHGHEGGDVVAHYAQMLEWLRGSGYRLDAALFSRREEYPNDVDLSRPPARRLMLPVVAGNR